MFGMIEFAVHGIRRRFTWPALRVRAPYDLHHDALFGCFAVARSANACQSQFGACSGTVSTGIPCHSPPLAHNILVKRKLDTRFGTRISSPILSTNWLNWPLVLGGKRASMPNGRDGVDGNWNSTVMLRRTDQNFHFSTVSVNSNSRCERAVSLVVRLSSRVIEAEVSSSSV